MPYPQPIGERAGIEIEVANVSENQASDFLHRTRSLPGWNQHHDGSTQDRGYAFVGLPYNLREFTPLTSGRSLGRSITTGAEFVSPIIDLTMNKWRDQVSYLCDWLVKTAKETPSYRTSVHVHISAGGLPVYVLKNLLRLWSFLEAPMYRLSLGDLPEHRGQRRKQYSYCRPLSSPPVVFDQNNRLRPSFDVPSLLKATSVSEFFWGYGANDITRDPIRWHPARYTGLNLLSMLTIGTVEFRTFNESTNPETICTWVDLSQAFLQAAIQSKGLGNDDYPTLSLGYNGDFNLSTLQVLLELPDSVMQRLEPMWAKSTWPTFSGLPLFNSNNDNTVLQWRSDDLVTMPPDITGTPVMLYAPASNGRRSETELMVFTDYDSYASVRPSDYLNEEHAVHAVQNWLSLPAKKDDARPAQEPAQQLRVSIDEARRALGIWRNPMPVATSNSPMNIWDEEPTDDSIDDE
jgi:hypothetical protein